MNRYRPAEIGMALEDVDTPALLLDLDAFEFNIQLMAGFAEKFKINHRPHAKTHKSPVVAQKQIVAGAVGQCCQKVAEAEILVAGGISDGLVSNQIVGRRKLDRLAGLARNANISVCVDDKDNINQIISFGKLSFDTERNELWDHQNLIYLTSSESKIMQIFSKSIGVPITRFDLIKALRTDGKPMNDRAIDVQITRLRRKIERNPKEPRYLQTLRGIGYMLSLIHI